MDNQSIDSARQVNEKFYKALSVGSAEKSDLLVRVNSAENSRMPVRLAELALLLPSRFHAALIGINEVDRAFGCRGRPERWQM